MERIFISRKINLFYTYVICSAYKLSRPCTRLMKGVRDGGVNVAAVSGDRVSKQTERREYWSGSKCGCIKLIGVRHVLGFLGASFIIVTWI